MNAVNDLNVLLIIPVYNHGKTLPAVVRSALATGLPVLVVDDGSTDNGTTTLVGLGCKIIHFPENKGKGAAILAGAREAERLGYRAIVTVDADGQHAPEDVHLLLQKDADSPVPSIIIGARQMIQDTVPTASRFGRSFSNFWVRLECGLDLADTQSGLRLYPVKELLQLKLSRTRFDFEIETLVKAAWAGIPIQTVAVSVHYPPAGERISHFHKLKDNIRLTMLHTALVIRRLLPLPHKRIIRTSPSDATESQHTGRPSIIRKRLEFFGHSIFYLVLRLCGQTGAYGLLFPVILTYILFSRKIHRLTGHYLERRFPQHSRGQRWIDTCRNVLSFGRILVDRAWLGCVRNAFLADEVIGREKIDAIIAAGKGAILLTAHVGNWQTALANLHFLKVPVHALMQYDQQAAARHYFDLGERQRTFSIINADGPFGGMIEATAALQRGEFVTIMGDRLTRGPSSTVDFIGEKARFPNASYTLAAHVGVPVIIFLAAKTGRKCFQMKVWDILYPQFESRESHQKILGGCSQKFAEALEKYLKVFPYQWYNFFNFWAQ